MPKFYCKEDSCVEFQKIITFSKVRYYFQDGDIVAVDPITKDRFICPNCSSILEELQEDNGICTYIGKWSSMPDREKKKILKKRADEDFKKHGKEEKEFRKKKIIEKYKS